MFGRRNAGSAAATASSTGILPPETVARAILSAFKEAYSRPAPDGRKGIKIETLLSGLGAMAGFACQMAARAAVKHADPTKVKGTDFAEVKTKDGGVYYFGDYINQPLIELRPTSVYSLIGGAAQRMGAPVPDITEIVGFVARSVGTEQFGTLRVAPEHQPLETPLQTLQRQWAGGDKMMDSVRAAPLMRGWHYALAVQLLIVEGKNVIAPVIGVQIALESAVAMSKVDPRLVGVAV